MNECQLSWRKVQELQGHITKMSVTWSVLGPMSAETAQLSSDACNVKEIQRCDWWLLVAGRVKINDEFRKNKDVTDVTAIDEVVIVLH